MKPPRDFFQILMIDALFLILVIFASYQLLSGLAQDTIAVSQMISEQMEIVGKEGLYFTREEIFQALLSNAEFTALYSNIVGNIVLLGLIFVVLYCICQAATWWLATGKIIPFMTYLYRFSLVSAVWFFLLFMVLMIYALVVQSIESLFIPGLLRTLYLFVLGALIAVLSYILVIMYYFIKEKSMKIMLKKSFAEGYRKFNTLFWKILLVGLGKLGLVIVAISLVTLLGFSPLVGAAIIIVLLVPYLAFAKLRIVKVISDTKT